MTIHHHREGASVQETAPDCVPLPDGRIMMWLAGRYGPVSRFDAVSEYASLRNSPIPESRQRAAAIMAALYPERIAA